MRGTIDRTASVALVLTRIALGSMVRATVRAARHSAMACAASS